MLTLKVVSMFNLKSSAIFVFNSLPLTLCNEISAYCGLFGRYEAQDGMQVILKTANEKTSVIECFEFDWGKKFSTKIDSTNYPYCQYFFPKDRRFYLNIFPKEKYIFDEYFHPEILTYDRQSMIHSSNVIAFREESAVGHNSIQNQCYFIDGRIVQLVWKATPLSKSKITLSRAKQYYIEGEYLIFEDQKNHLITENVLFHSVTKYRLKRVSPCKWKCPSILFYTQFIDFWSNYQCHCEFCLKGNKLI